MADNPGVSWKHNLDAELEDAGAQNRSVLVDFSAAPM